MITELPGEVERKSATGGIADDDDVLVSDFVGRPSARSTWCRNHGTYRVNSSSGTVRAIIW
ncbi:hypothetical protein [Nocardia carnea]|uniref:hypothetical protein n=1 Tax=Nocardia carnea TaxID=37328 RepID=UPI002454DC9C|nr:hypothetical protein [Nocardia carnea]